MTSSTSVFDRSSWSRAAAKASRFALAALAKLTAGRIVAEVVGLGNFGELGVEGVLVMGAAGGGVLVRSEAVREFVRDIGCELKRSLVVSRSFSRRSATSRSRVDTSTGLHHSEIEIQHGFEIAYFALPKGFERGLGPAEAEAILGEDNGLGLAELLVERGISSSLRLASCGVGGVELLAFEKCLVLLVNDQNEMLTHETCCLAPLAVAARSSSSRYPPQPRKQAPPSAGPYPIVL